MPSHNIEDMPIVWEGDAGGPDGDPKPVFRMRIKDKWFWFIAEELYEANGNDFRLFVSSFGLRKKASALSTGDQFREKFTKAAEEVIKNRLTTFFLGEENKPFPPFMLRKARCIGISFSPRWIITT